ncbi:MAG: hypothetical protein CMK32_10115 [Porticoccaceae bacterium]|nr:hypothetical protein [Porticoccaceae bacterium]
MSRIGPRVVGVDPGTWQSAWAWIDGTEVIEHGYCANEDLLQMIRDRYFGESELAIEMVASYGLAVGSSTFETVRWIGRFQEAYELGSSGTPAKLLYRKQDSEGIPAILLHICKNSRAGDSNVRQAIIDMYEPTGGGKVPQVGTKKNQGPLYGISSHVWQALAVAITCRDALNA